MSRRKASTSFRKAWIEASIFSFLSAQSARSALASSPDCVRPRSSSKEASLAAGDPPKGDDPADVEAQVKETDRQLGNQTGGATDQEDNGEVPRTKAPRSEPSPPAERA